MYADADDRLYNQYWGFYVLGTSHIDHAEHFPGEWYGKSETAEARIADDARNAWEPARVDTDALNFYNYLPYDEVQGDHILYGEARTRYVVASLAGLGAAVLMLMAYGAASTSIEAVVDTPRAASVTLAVVCIAGSVALIEMMVRRIPEVRRQALRGVSRARLGLVAIAGVLLGGYLGVGHAPGGPGYADSWAEFLAATFSFWVAASAMTLIDWRLPWLLAIVVCGGLYLVAIL